MVAHHDQEEVRAGRLWRRIGQYIEEGKRDPKAVADVLQVIKDDPQFFARFFPADKSAEAQLKVWQKRYKKLGIKINVAQLYIPQKPEGLDRLIVVPRELRKPSAVIRILKERMSARKEEVWTFTDLSNLDSRVSDIVSRPESDYAIWVRDRQEAAEELAYKSAEMIQKEGLNTETLTERLFHELAFNEETGKHLDEKNRTLCSGSRCTDADGYVGVPDVDWSPHDGRLYIYWCNLAVRYGYLRGRLAVSS